MGIDATHSDLEFLGESVPENENAEHLKKLYYGLAQQGVNELRNRLYVAMEAVNALFPKGELKLHIHEDNESTRGFVLMIESGI